jgi:WD40 repeat protein
MKKCIFTVLIVFAFINQAFSGIDFGDLSTKTLITNDEKYLFEIDGKILKIFDHENESFLNEMSFSESITHSSISPNSKFLALAYNDKVALINIENRAISKTWAEHGALVSALIFSNNSEFLISSSYDNTACIYDLKTMNLNNRLVGHTSQIYSIEISNNDNYCVTSSGDQTSRMWDFRSGKELQVFAHYTSVYQSLFVHNSNQIMTLSNDDTLRIWDIKTGIIASRTVLPLDKNDRVKKIKLSPSGKYLLAMSGQLAPTLFIYDLVKKDIHAEIHGLTNHAIDFGITRNEKFYYLHSVENYTLGEISSGKIFHAGNNFIVCSKNYIYANSLNGNLIKYSIEDLSFYDEGFYYVILESRPRIFLISCAADKYDRFGNLQNCISDAEKVIRYFEKSKHLEQQIADLKILVSKTKNSKKLKYENQLDSIQFLLSKEPILILQKLHDYNLSYTPIIKAFNDVKNQMRYNDAFVFHFAGMGGKGGKSKNSELSTLFFSKDTTTFTASDLFQLSEIINGNNQLYILDACQDDFVSQFKSELINNKTNSQLINRNRVFLAIEMKGKAVDNYKGTGGGALTYAFINNNVPFFQIFSFDNRLKNEYDYKLYNGTKEISEDKSLNFEIFHESDFYDIEIKEKLQTRGIIFEDHAASDKPNTINEGQTLSVVVGINDYDNFTPLTNPILDAVQVANILEKSYGHKVILLKDLNYAAIRDTLYEISEKYSFKDCSQFLFYFAGHGAYNKYDNSSCLMFKDSKITGDRDFEKELSASTLKGLINQIKSTRTMVVIDACHSRKLTEKCKEAECMVLDHPLSSKEFKSYLKSPGKVIFTSANVFQEASDGAKYNYSPFANAFMASLNDRSLKKFPFDSKAVYKDMLKYQSDKTKNKHFQSEMKYCSYNDSNKDDDRFIFIPE